MGDSPCVFGRNSGDPLYYSTKDSCGSVDCIGGWGFLSSAILQFIANHCKSSLIPTDQQGFFHSGNICFFPRKNSAVLQLPQVPIKTMPRNSESNASCGASPPTRVTSSASAPASPPSAGPWPPLGAVVPAGIPAGVRDAGARTAGRTGSQKLRMDRLPPCLLGHFCGGKQESN